MRRNSVGEGEGGRREEEGGKGKKNRRMGRKEWNVKREKKEGWN